ncbi:phytoene synthase [Nocardia tenerifensis]|uniref:Phytoene synthase n=1 Tax=Nocardia tenerifensis TaxID=228006 RepID=A0A318JQV1_9NOCA|nr:phytoene/squalene synthase family protein [Nocardia tenerifensis]PXX58111.1 phytoene synthase [Nocardia tenerifensis]
MRHADTQILDAAGIESECLRAAYVYCRRLHAQYGRTYYLATTMLPRWKRPYVHALYGFARYADEIVDNSDPASRAEEFTRWRTAVTEQLEGGSGSDPVCRALGHTLRTWQIPLDHVTAFLTSMEKDLTVTRYATFGELNDYMYGSAAVIGLQMTPILGPLEDEAYERAQALGRAFQLTNFLRDIGEDLARGRVYLPQEDLRRFEVTTDDLAAEHASDSVRRLLRFEIARTRDIYAYAWGGIRMLEPGSRPCIEIAHTLYSGILDAIEAADHDILRRRVTVSLRRRLSVAIPAYRSARSVSGETAPRMGAPS